MLHSVGFLVVAEHRYRADQAARTCRTLGVSAIVGTAGREAPDGTIAVIAEPPPGLAGDAPIAMLAPELVVLGSDWIEGLGTDIIRQARKEGQRVVADVDQVSQLDGPVDGLYACDGAVCAVHSVRQLLAPRRRCWIAHTTIDAEGRGARAQWSRILTDVAAG